MEAKRNGRWGAGGGHTLQPLSLGIGDKCPPPTPNFPSLVWDWEESQNSFILHDQTTGDLKSHHLQARATLTAMSVPQRPLFLSAELWVIRYHLGHLGIIMHYRIYSQYHIMQEKVLFMAPMASSGEGGTYLPCPLPGTALTKCVN